MNEPNSTGVRVVVYKKILDGDIKKMQEKSNIATSGGGARYLSFNPGSEFRPIFMKMFPNEIKPGTLAGKLYWLDAPTAEVISTEVIIDIHTDGKVRKEVRLCQVNKCLRNRPVTANDCIFIMIMDDLGRIWPYFTSEDSLLHDYWNQDVASGIIMGLRAKRPKNQAAAGYLDYDTETVYTNGEII